MKRNIFLKPIEVKVRCSGELHRIVLSENGQLCLCDHRGRDRKKADTVTMALTGRKLKCYEILEVWRETCTGYFFTKQKNKLPKKLKEEARKRNDIRLDRMLKSRILKEKEQTIEKISKLEFLKQKILEALGKCSYEFAKNKALNTVTKISDESSSSHFVELSFYGPTFVQTRISFYFCFNWCYKIYKRKLAVVDGHLVTKIISENNNTIEAMLLREKKFSVADDGYDLYECPAVIKERPSGCWYVAHWDKKF